MRIKKLEIQGFKSFKDKTTIQFDEGITGVVGPNGCGKSNIVDALVWVMGEMSAKHLRGASMEDVIFAGSEGYAPLGMAEVSLTLENDGGPFPVQYSQLSEVQVTRKLHRSGDSEYLINKQPARLRDIHEIFMDTGAGAKGFSIIEQGQIGKIITAKPTDRRNLIEEAAGITKFKARKKESERKLKATEQNLLRLEDILRELKRQMDSLERQAKKAEKFKVIKDELEDKDILLGRNAFFKTKEVFEVRGQQIEHLEEEILSLDTQMSESQNQQEEMKLSHLEEEKEITMRQQSIQELSEKIKVKEELLRSLKFNVEQAKQHKSITGGLIDKYQAKKEALEIEFNSVTQQYDETNTKFQSAAQELKDQEEVYTKVQTEIEENENELYDRQKKINTIDQSLTEMRVSLENLQSRLQEEQDELSEYISLFDEIEKDKKQFETRYKELSNKFEEEKQLKLNIVNDIENLKENLQTKKATVTELTAQCDPIEKEIKTQQGKLEGLQSLEKDFAGYDQSTQDILASIDTLKPIINYFEVEPEYETAISNALSFYLLGVVSTSTGLATDQLKVFKDNQEGELRILLHSDQPMGADSFSGFLGYLSQFCKVTKDEGKVTDFLSSVAVFDNFDNLYEASKKETLKNKLMIALDGTTYDRGWLRRGTPEKSAKTLLERKRQIGELETSIAKLEMSFIELNKQKNEAERACELLDTEIQQIQEKKSEQDVLVAQIEKDVQQAHLELKQAEKSLNQAFQKKDKIESKINEKNEKIQQVSDKTTEFLEEKQELEEFVLNKNLEVENLKKSSTEIQESWTNAKVSFAELEQMTQTLEEKKGRVEVDFNESKNSLEEALAETEEKDSIFKEGSSEIQAQGVELETLTMTFEAMTTELSNIRNSFELKQKEINQFSESLSEYLIEKNKKQTEKLELERTFDQEKIQMEVLKEQINERYMVDLEQEGPLTEELTEEAISELNEVVTELKTKLKKVGEVNLSAIKEFEEVTERFTFLNTQNEDLLTSKKQLLKVIDRITEICDVRFRETFEAVNTRFSQVFPVLFGGGEAKLILIEGEEGKEMGIDIVSKPPGKKLQNVSLLSGGEKALTAVSLIFSIFLVKPSPYCLLDEVDAPLDDANVSRFNQLVTEMSKRSQIIIVTHNKNTMTIVNKLYGVTMQEKGVSKMVSVDLEQKLTDVQALASL